MEPRQCGNLQLDPRVPRADVLKLAGPVTDDRGETQCAVQGVQAQPGLDELCVGEGVARRIPGKGRQGAVAREPPLGPALA